MTKSYEKMTKNELLDLAKNTGCIFNAKMKKSELIALLKKNEDEVYAMMNESITNEKLSHFEGSSNSLAIIENEVATIAIENAEIPHEEETKTNPMMTEYAEFLQNMYADYNYTIHDDSFLVQGPKKLVAVKFDEISGHAFVYTILNTKPVSPEFARNILTLKSMKAVKSYTASNMK